MTHLVLISLAALANAVLGVAILSKDARNSINRYFAAFSLAVASWTLSNALVSAYADSPVGYVWGRLAFGSAAIIPAAFLLFASVFPAREPRPPAPLFRAFLGAAAAAFVTSLTPLIVRGTASTFSGSLRVEYGPLHIPFGLYFISCLAFSLYILIKKLLLLTGLQRLQVRYLFAGVLVAGVGATIANLLIPIIFHTSQFSPYGPLFGLFMIAVIAHAIIRYRLMDIKVVVRTGVVYACAIVCAGLVFAAALAILTHAGAYPRDTLSPSAAFGGALLLAILFQPLKNALNRSLNRYLYRETYDYPTIVRAASRHLSTMLSLEHLLAYLAGIIESTFKTERVSIYLRDPSTQAFTPTSPHALASTYDSNTSLSSPPSLSDLVTLLQAVPTTIVREEAERNIEDTRFPSAAALLAELGGDVAFPLLDDRTLAGIVVIGPKRSGDPYFSNDLDLLETLVSQAAIALANAQLYRQVVVANEYVDNILSTMDSGLIAVDSTGHISLFNAAAQALTGLDAVAMLRTSYHHLPSAIAAPLGDTLDLGASLAQFEALIPRPNARSLPVVCSTATLRVADGSTHGALIVFSDLTRLKDLEREKRRAERLASFGSLASGVAHEIKNPLVAIRTFAELLPERYSDVEFREDFSKVVIKEIARIDDLVGRLRGLAATPHSHVGLIDIREPVRDTLSLLRAQLEQTRTTYTLDCVDTSPFVAVEESQLKQLFLNLFLNAIEAMGQHGDLTIRISRKDTSAGACIVVEVSDTGPGIPDSLSTRIFEPFFTTKARGSGLGLAICRRIADAHRGVIRADNRADRRGTIITVEFPVATEHSYSSENALLRPA